MKKRSDIYDRWCGCSRDRVAAAFGVAWLILGLALQVAQSSPAWAQTVRNPRRLAAGPPGQLLVTERSLGSIVAVDKSSLEPVWSFELPDDEAPFGLATWNRLIFVGNTTTKNVEVYRLLGSAKNEPRLRFEYNLGHKPPGEAGAIEKPIAIAVDSGARLVFVLDGSEKKVKIFDHRGSFLSAFAPVDDAGEVMSPVSLAVDSTRQEVLVGDYGNPSGFFRARTPARILIYDYQGELQFQINGNGSTHETTRFARVQGMTASPDGRIFVTDPLASRILILDRISGALVGEVGVAGSEPGELMLPLDVHLDERSGDLFVSNNQGARRVEVFRGVGR